MFSQASVQQVISSGSAQSHDQQVRPSAPPNQGQKNQVSSSPQAYATPLGSQAQNNVNAMLNQPPRMNAAVSLQTRNMQQTPTQFQQSSQQLYGTSNPSAQAYPRSITGSMPLRPLSSVSETQPAMHPHGKMGTPPTHPTMQQSVVRPVQQKKGAKTNALPVKQDPESGGKARVVGTAKAPGKQASGGTKANKKSGGQKKPLEAAGSTQPPSSKKQKTAGAFQEQSIDQLNDVTAVSGVNLRADGGGGAELEKEKEESRPKNVKPNKEEDDKMRTTAANVAARQAVGGSDMLSKWQLMAEQARQKREGLDVTAASQPGRGPASRSSPMGKGSGDHQEGQKRSHSTAFGSGKAAISFLTSHQFILTIEYCYFTRFKLRIHKYCFTTTGMKRPGRGGFVGPQRTISVKDCISVLEREPQMTKSRLIYRLYERLPGNSTAD
ncbi:hypothetical protein PR202_ga12385 [Eleusine coracana subsp. coracana]|uniref:Transcription initiation factor TFIID component TAF4 C-terminal domain-containing protein n=1 Tax=Eleusine coracana subsp. coracana TaxID=191504 RepID=A0AAV5CBY0_ELECO|nr:hypothetical protein PR202_ga12385 [Eleusine coracana subsp. coracana]